MLGAIDARRRVFRHQLIFFLIGFDFLKAVTLLFYPARVALVKTAYYNSNFCDIVGFFTAMAIEGADLAIFSFAIHTALLIFRPNKKFKNGDKIEGGLFPYRYLVLLFSFLFPIVLASLAFVQQTGYVPLKCWCYLPERPRWYRLVLSWIPRYIIVITILCVYVAIYFHVIRQFNRILAIHEEINNRAVRKLRFNRHFFTNLWYLVREYMKIGESRSQETSGSTTDVGEESFKNDDPTKLLKSFHEATFDAFDQRRNQIEKQMKSIFIYPISYIFLWLAPFALQCIQYDWELRHGPVYWLTAISAFMQPFNCTVDTFVFLIRETPWNYTVLKVTRRIKEKRGAVYENDRFIDYYKHHETWRKYFGWLPLYYVPDLSYDFGEPNETVTNEEVMKSGNHDFSAILGGFNETEFRNTADTSRNTSSTLENPFSGHEASGTQRSSTVISTSDFYSGKKRNRKTDHSRFWKKSRSKTDLSQKHVFPDGYELKEVPTDITEVAKDPFHGPEVVGEPEKADLDDKDSDVDFMEFLKKGPS